MCITKLLPKGRNLVRDNDNNERLELNFIAPAMNKGIDSVARHRAYQKNLDKESYFKEMQNLVSKLPILPGTLEILKSKHFDLSQDIQDEREDR